MLARYPPQTRRSRRVGLLLGERAIADTSSQQLLATMHWLHAVLHLALVPTRSPAACGRSRRAQPVRMVGADLEGGENEQRNAALAALRRSFLASSAEEEERPSGEAEDASKLGLYLDVPVCRWSFPILPHHRTVLNVYQAQYTLAFEKLLATPEPWLYAHVMLPGGVDNLADPEFALAAPDSKAPAHGTLMQIVAVQREADSRLTLLVQGLARGPLKGTGNGGNGRLKGPARGPLKGKAMGALQGKAWGPWRPTSCKACTWSNTKVWSCWLAIFRTRGAPST